MHEPMFELQLIKYYVKVKILFYRHSELLKTINPLWSSNDGHAKWGRIKTVVNQIYRPIPDGERWHWRDSTEG